MSGLWLLVLFALSIFAIVGAKGAKWELLNSLVILAFMAAGVAIGVGLGAWYGNGTIGGHIAAPLMILIGAFGCIRRNKHRDKQVALPPLELRN